MRGLSQAEWTVVAYFCLHGVERFANTAQTEMVGAKATGTRVSQHREAKRGASPVLAEFQAVYGLLRKPNKTHLDSFFVAHLPPDRQAEAKKPEEIGSDDVRRAVTHTLRMLTPIYCPSPTSMGGRYQMITNPDKIVNGSIRWAFVA
jgi:hypothetical protein